MASRHAYRPEDVGFVQIAPVRFMVERSLPCSPEELFAVFEDAEAWTQWAGLKSVVWTSDLPVRVGTTRDAVLGPVLVQERFIAWQRGTHMAFFFESGTTRALNATVEDYRVTGSEDGKCHLQWRFGLELRGVAKILQPLLPLVMKWQCGRALKALESLLAEKAEA